MVVSVYDFFSGCGGASCGFRAAGMKISYALDLDADAAASFKANFAEAYFEHADIRDICIESIHNRMENERNNLVLFTACAPCQPFTRLNTNRTELDRDERKTLLSHFTAVVDHCHPDLLFLENVPGLQMLDRTSQPFGKFLNSLNHLDYSVDYRAVRLARYGVPQSRRRLILVASRHGKISLPNATHGPGTSNDSYVTVRDCIERFPRIYAGEKHHELSNHVAAKLSVRNLERIRATPEGGGHSDWPDHLRLECHKNFSGYSDVYGRMSWDAPAPGLTTRCVSYSNGRFGHPEQNRAISIREAACLQTFPKSYIFKGNFTSMARQIGNAVPARLTKIIGWHFIKHLNNLETSS